MIALPDGPAHAFAAGQYINIVLEDGQRRAFSFANPPHENGQHRAACAAHPGRPLHGHVFERMRLGDTLRFEGPLGSFTLHDSTRPILFVAGATGFAPVKSIVEDAFHRGVQRPMRLYWGVRQRADLYLLELAKQLGARARQLPVSSPCSRAAARGHWRGRTGLVHEAMLADFRRPDGYEVYVCGSLRMVEAAVPAFIASGLGENAVLLGCVPDGGGRGGG